MLYKKYLAVRCASVLSIALGALPAWSQGNKQDQPVTASYEGNIFKPVKVAPTEARLNALKLPAGFKVTKFAENLGNPRMIAVSPDGTVYVTSREAGTVTMLKDANGDGRAETQKEVAKKENMHGLAIDGKKMYLVAVNDVYATDIRPDGTLGDLTRIVTGLPEGGQHNNRTLVMGPDQHLYISVGSTCNACEETSDLNATMVRVKPDGTDQRIFAKGLRNTIGFAFHPQTKELYGFDHGIDWLGDEGQREELNLIREGENYGWPYVYENGKANPADAPPGDTTHADYAKKTTFPVLTYEAHSAPMAMVFYTGNKFPEAYRNSAFVALHGSWNRKEPSGYKVVRVKFENGKPAGFEDFLTGFLARDNREQFGRVCGIAQHPDGSLLISDDDNGVLYRVAYAGK
jgi:glucose/arabinose dehydrogenase